MIYAIAINLALTILVGFTLWLVWRRDRDQRFLLSFSLMNLCAGTLMVSHLAWSSSNPLLHVVGSIVGPLASAAHVTLSLRAIVELQGQKPELRTSAMLFATLVLLFGANLVTLDSLEIYGALYGTVWLLIGGYAVKRLWHRGWSERIIAPLFAGLGLNTLVIAFLGEAWFAELYVISCILRVALAMAVMYCALARTFNAAVTAKARFEHLSQNARHGIVVCSADRMLYANPAAMRIFGFSSLEQALQGDMYASVPEQHRAAAVDDVRALLAGKNEFMEAHRQGLRQDGTPVRLHISGWRTDWDGAPAVEMLITDETERYQAQQALKVQQELNAQERAAFAESSKNALLKANSELEQRVAEKTRSLEAASQAKSQFLANMSHEIRTPMNVILGLLQLLHGTPQSTLQGDYTDKAQRAARALLNLLNDLLDFSKIDAGKMDLECVPFEVERLFRDLAVISATPRDSKPVELLFDLDPAMPAALVGDAMRLQQVLMNLTANAIKFTERGEVVVKVQVLSRSVDSVTLHVAVQDTGIGISEADQKHIFDLFSQAEASTTRRFGGTGLGLSICRQLLALMGSELHVQSVPGQGSTFFFDIQLPLADLRDEAGQLARLPSPDSAGLRVLVVEDNPVARQLLASMAAALGWQVETADSGEQAVAMVQARLQSQTPMYQTVVVDWNMGGMDGWATLARIQAITPAHQLPTSVMVSAFGRDQLAMRSGQEQERLSAYLVKPVTMAMLNDAVRSARSGRGNMRATARPVVERQRRLDGLKLLLVEDNPLNQLVARELLSAEGATVEVANNGSLGVQALSQPGSHFDVVLMDMQMPVMDGCSATRVIRSELGLGPEQLPIIAMTANTMQSDRDACLAAGMNDHVSKPFDISYLVDVLRKQTGRYVELRPSAPAPILEAVEPAAHSLDVESAIADMGGDAELYQQILQIFLQDLNMLEEGLQTLFEAGDRIGAIRLLHTLKGNAATVGARHMSAVARAAELELKTASAGYAAQALLQRVAAAASTTLQAFAAARAGQAG